MSGDVVVQVVAAAVEAAALPYYVRVVAVVLMLSASKVCQRANCVDFCLLDRHFAIDNVLEFLDTNLSCEIENCGSGAEFFREHFSIYYLVAGFPEGILFNC